MGYLKNNGFYGILTLERIKKGGDGNARESEHRVEKQVEG